MKHSTLTIHILFKFDYSILSNEALINIYIIEAISKIKSNKLKADK